MDIQIISLEADINFLGSKQEAVYLEQDMFFMQWIKRLQKVQGKNHKFHKKRADRYSQVTITII